MPTAEEVTRHPVGWAMRAGHGEASCPISCIDPVRRRCVTESSRTYHLRGASGSTANTRYVWSVCKGLNGIHDAHDVTGELALHLKAARQQH